MFIVQGSISFKTKLLLPIIAPSPIVMPGCITALVPIKPSLSILTNEILRFCLENGLLVDKEILGLFSETRDLDSVKLIINKLKNQTSRFL